MGLRLATVPILAAGALALCGTSLAGTPAENAAATAQLTPLIKAKFKKVAPKLVLRKVTCVTQKNGVDTICKASFTYAPAHLNVVYTMKATLHDLGGTLTLTATGHTCTDQKTGKKVSC